MNQLPNLGKHEAGTEPIDPKTERGRRMDARCPVKRLVRLVAGLLGTALVVAACSAPTAPPARPEQAELDCTRELYPCRFSEVDVAVIARSMALGRLAQQMFLDGDDAQQVAAVLAAEEDVAYLGVGDGGVVFRLEGGRPVVVNPSVDQVIDEPQSLAGGSWQGARLASARAASDGTSPHGASLRPSRVVGGDGLKSALVLSPFAYETGENDSAGYVAGLLNAHYDYEGRVDYEYSKPYSDEIVTIDDLLGMDEYDVVYLVTHGGRLCVREKTAEAPGLVAPANQQSEAGDCRTDFLLQRYEGDAFDLHALEHVGTVIYYGSQHQSIAVTSDFFRHYYPFGLPDTLFVLVSCSTFAPDFAATIAGDHGVFVSWGGNVSVQRAWASAALIEIMLEKGITSQDALLELGDDAWDPQPGGRLRTTGRGEDGDLRIRNILRVEEAHSGDDLRHAVETKVLGAPGDGEPDSLLLFGHIDGAWETDAVRFEVVVHVDGQERFAERLEQIGEMIDEHSWTFPMEVELGRDVLPGEVLDVEVVVMLPEGGFVSVGGSPRVVDQGPASGWFGSFTYRAMRADGISYETTATALFTLPDGADPSSDYLQFFLASGQYSFLAEGEDGYSCMVHAEANGQLGPSSAYLWFDMTGTTPVVKAWGNSGTPPTIADVACPGEDFYQIEFATDTPFLYIPSSLNLAVSGDSFAGSYTDLGPWDKTWTWSFERRD